MAKRNQDVCIKVNKKFFDNIFEPERRKLSKKYGVNITQSNFTAILASSNAKIKYPKLNNTGFFSNRRRRFSFSI